MGTDQRGWHGCTHLNPQRGERLRATFAEIDWLPDSSSASGNAAARAISRRIVLRFFLRWHTTSAIWG
jgi:hypothetical protein